MSSSRLLTAFLVLLPFLLFQGCGGGGGGSSPAELRSVTVSPATLTLAAGTVKIFTAIGTYSDNSTRDLTASAFWSSSSNTVATVSNISGSKGKVTAVAAGTARITATVANLSGSANVTVTAGVQPEGANVMTISVNGSLCSAATSDYMNKPCVSVTICTPGTSNCKTISDVLLDTGSYGLRIFNGAASGLSLPQVTTSTGSLAGCVEFADGSSLWGPVKRAAVKLGGEPAVEIPIQIVDASFGSTNGTRCAVESTNPYVGPDRTPAEAGFTGILGVGVAAYDCGATCVNSAIGVYYSCAGGSCAPTTVPLEDQLRNPATALPVDNNGLIVQLPSVPLDGVISTTGSLMLGIGTRSNNTPGSPTVLPTDATGNFITVFNGVTFNDAFLDTGSNAFYIPNVARSLLPPCSGGNSDWYCPPSTVALTATTRGAGGAPSTAVTFRVANALSLFNSPNNVFNDVAGTSSFGFDWGLPFFLGRRVLYGFEGMATPALGAIGPFVAY